MRVFVVLARNVFAYSNVLALAVSLFAVTGLKMRSRRDRRRDIHGPFHLLGKTNRLLEPRPSRVCCSLLASAGAAFTFAGQ